MKLLGIIGIRTVQKGNNNGRTCYSGTAVFKVYTEEKEIPFLCNVSNAKQEQFYDQYLMQPGKSGFATGSLNANPNGLFFQIDSIEFGSFKFNGASNGGYQQQHQQQPQQQNTTMNISAPNNDFNFGAFNTPQNTPSNEETVRSTTPNNNFWGNMGSGR